MASNPRVYGYIRWSSDEQGHGDSLKRQSGMVEKWATANGHALSEITILKDEGVSAYKGDNLKDTAQLGKFILDAENGVIPKGSILLVENPDRLTRRGTEEAMEIITRIIKPGVKLITLSDGESFEYGKRTTFSLIKQIIESERAHSESKEKARRVSEAWARKHKAAREHGTPVTSRMPAWLHLDKEKNEITVIPERASMVNRIFQMCLDGEGLTAIANQFNIEGIEPWGPRRVRAKIHKDQPRRWHRSYIKKVLDSRAVFGEYLPHYKTKGKSDPIKDYFPVVVSKNIYDQAHGAMKSRKTGAGRIGKVTSLFTGLIKCGKCGSSINCLNKGNNRNHPNTYLTCSLKIAKGGCDSVTINYYYFEKAFLEYCLEVNLKDIVNQDKAAVQRKEAQAQLDTVVGALAEVEGKIENAMGLLGRIKNKAMEERLALELDQFGEEQEALQSKKDTLESKIEELSRPGNGAAIQIQTIRDLQEKLKGLSETEKIGVRKKIKHAITAIVDEIVIFQEGVQGTLPVFTDNGLKLIPFEESELYKQNPEFMESKRGEYLGRTTGRNHAAWIVNFKNGHSRMFEWSKKNNRFEQVKAAAFGQYITPEWSMNIQSTFHIE